MKGVRLIAGATIAAAAWAQPSPLIFPEQRIPLRFSHQKHLALNLKCEFCHAAAESRRASDLLIPSEETCTTCHPIDRADPKKQAEPVAACDGCHPGYAGEGEPSRVMIPKPNIRFNHRVHVERGIDCLSCHAGVPTVDLATRANLPRMMMCLSCHDGRQAPARCTTCHVGASDGRVKTTLAGGKLMPSGVLRGDTHDLRFRTDHGRVAANDESYCQNCHRPEECQSCHDGVQKPLDIHGNEYLTLHAAEARRNQPDCSSCHRRQTFCVGCHQRTGIALPRDVQALSRDADLSTNGFFTSGRRFHPEGWAVERRGPQHHSVAAQRNIAECASCHREETCLGCHATNAVTTRS